jgi:hypothetical protein
MSITQEQFEATYDLTFNQVKISSPESIAKNWANDILMIEEQRKEIAALTKKQR